MAKNRCEGEQRPRYKWTLTVKSFNGENSAVHLDPTDPANWTDTGKKIKANFETKAGREFFNAEQVQADQSHLLETPSTNFSRSIVPKWRLELGTRIFQVVSAVDKNEERRVVQITVKETK